MALELINDDGYTDTAKRAKTFYRASSLLGEVCLGITNPQSRKNMEMKLDKANGPDKHVSPADYFPKEIRVLERILKKHGGEISEKAFDRIFSNHQRLRLSPTVDGRPRYQDHIKMHWYFNARSRYAPTVQLLGLVDGTDGVQQGFLWLAQALKIAGRLLIEKHDDDLVYYKLIDGKI